MRAFSEIPFDLVGVDLGSALPWPTIWVPLPAEVGGRLEGDFGIARDSVKNQHWVQFRVQPGAQFVFGSCPHSGGSLPVFLLFSKVQPVYGGS